MLMCKKLCIDTCNYLKLIDACEKIEYEYEYIYDYFPFVNRKIIKITLKFSYMRLNQLKLPNGLLALDMGSFNQPIELQLPDTLLELNMGLLFNQPIELPDRLEHLTMSHCYSQPIIIGNNLKYLKMGISFNHPIDFSQMHSLKYLVICSSSVLENQFTCQHTIPEFLEHLEINCTYNSKIVFPHTLKYLTLTCEPRNSWICKWVPTPCPTPIWYKRKFSIIVPTKLHTLNIPHSLMSNIIFPESLKVLGIINSNNIIFSEEWVNCDHIPNSVEKIVIKYVKNICFNNFPSSVKYVDYVYNCKEGPDATLLKNLYSYHMMCVKINNLADRISSIMHFKRADVIENYFIENEICTMI